MFPHHTALPEHIEWGSSSVTECFMAWIVECMQWPGEDQMQEVAAALCVFVTRVGSLPSTTLSVILSM